MGMPAPAPAAVLAVLFVFLQPRALALPGVSSASPAQGTPGTQVVISGSGFSTATLVKFNTTIADFVASSDTRMVATVPPDATCGPIFVTNPTGTGQSAAGFLVAPRITGFSPARGAVGTSVTVEGFNFALGATVLVTNVFFGEKPAAFTVTAATQVQAIVPAGATNGPMTVRTSAGSVTTTNLYTIVGPAPVIDDFSPRAGAPGANILIYGVNFKNVVGVKFGSGAASTFAASADTQIQALVPDSGATGPITVTTASGTAISAAAFTVTRAPVITNFFPQYSAPGRSVTVEGINFTNITGVGISGRAAAWGIQSAHQISVVVPATATNSGPITITNTSGVGSSATNLIITRAPIIDSFNPIQGAAGSAVAISGVNLSNGPTVLKFNGVNAPFTVTGQNGIQVQATVPNGAATGPITMTNAYGSFTTSSNFFVTGSLPFVTGATPSGGPRGTTVIVTGGNFANPVTVKFNGVSSSDATATALTQIQATVPSTATTGPLTVATAAGTSATNTGFYLPPRLASFTPTNGVVGDTVTLSGLNFTDAGSLRFNNSEASFTVTAPGSMTAVIPPDATTGPLTVSTPGGLIISTNSFRVLPNITGFSPVLGPVGTQVTILGTSFINVTNVTFNNTRATNYTVVSSGEIRAVVPPGATAGPVRVSTADGTAVSAASYTVTGPSDLAVDLQASAYLLTPGQPLTYTLYAQNKGPSTVTGVVLTDVLPPGVDLVSVTSTNTTCNVTNRTITCPIPVFPAQTTHKVEIAVIARLEGVLTDSASLTAVEPELGPSDNTAEILVTVVADASRTLRIDLTSNGGQAVVSWPTSAVPFGLEFTGSLVPPLTWLPFNSAPVVVNGRNTVTNDTAAGRRFFRLIKP